MRTPSGLLGAMGACAMLAAASPAVAQKAQLAPAALQDAPAPRGAFSPLAAVAVLDKVCKPAVEKLQGADRLAAASGLEPGAARPDIAWALPQDARLWAVESVDSDVFVYAYGPGLTQCGAVIARPLSGTTGQRVRDQLLDPAHGFAIDTEQTLAGGVQFTRLKGAGFRFADLMDYPSANGAPGLVKIELLPIS